MSRKERLFQQLWEAAGVMARSTQHTTNRRTAHSYGREERLQQVLRNQREDFSSLQFYDPEPNPNSQMDLEARFYKQLKIRKEPYVSVFGAQKTSKDITITHYATESRLHFCQEDELRSLYVEQPVEQFANLIFEKGITDIYVTTITPGRQYTTKKKLLRFTSQRQSLQIVLLVTHGRCNYFDHQCIVSYILSLIEDHTGIALDPRAVSSDRRLAKQKLNKISIGRTR